MSIQGKNNSMKDYYINLQTLYNNAVNMLTGINQSLSTSASEITVTVADTNNATSTVRIPSFLYLENKLEQLDSNFKTLFNMPESGEAWFSNADNMYKVEMVKANTSPLTPRFDVSNLFSYTKQNNIFKDLVNPKTYLRLNIDNLPDNINEIYMKKIIFHNSILYNNVASSGLKTYNEIKNGLYNYNVGIDYEEYDSVIKTPLKYDSYISQFKIIEIPELESGNPWTPEDNAHLHLRYKIRLDQITYVNNEDNSIKYSLKIGDYITLENENVVYKVVNIESNTGSSLSEFYIEIEEIIGHIALQTFEENQNMVLKLYKNNFDKFHYVELPLEENEYVCMFIGTVHNNVRSIMSEAIMLDLNNIQMKDEHGNFIYETNSNTPMTYIQYYNKYCKNIGDLLLGFIETTYPQLSNYGKSDLNDLQNSEDIKNMVSSTIDNTNILTVQKINDHLMDDVTTENIVKLHTEKSELNIQLQNLQNNIDETYNLLITTDFSQDTSVTQDSLRAKLDEYYSQRRTLQNQQISIVENINLLKGNVKSMNNPKFRVRGTTVTTSLEEYLHSKYDNKCDIIGLEVQYKYKSINSDTTNVSVINSAVYTDWNRCINIDKERKLVFDDNGNYSIQYENYDSINNIIKWNQIDIPINQGEDVVIRIRYKYSIGQPFINFYSPWSEELIMGFPAELTEVNEMSSILSTNETDTVSAKFNNTLINEGYQEHISNKLIDESQIFFHMPENIYSGFNTAENKLISLKDKLNSMVNDLESYKSLITNEINSQYKVFLEYDNLSIELSNSADNNIVINYDNTINNESFIRKNMNIIIKNTGSTNLNFYSLFPGNINMPLLLTQEQFYDKYILDYERVPLLYGDSMSPYENIYTQKLGQWIYFRYNNPYSKREYYYNDKILNDQNLLNAIECNNYIKNSKNSKNSKTITHYDEISEQVISENSYYCKFSKNNKDDITFEEYIGLNNSQALLGYRSRSNDIRALNSNLYWQNIRITGEGASTQYEVAPQTSSFQENLYSDIYQNMGINFFMPISQNDYLNNNFLLCYEHICGTKDSGSGDKEIVYLTEADLLSSFASSMDVKGFSGATIDKFAGAFFIPKLKTDKDLLCDNLTKNQSKQLEVGKALSIPVIFEYFLVDRIPKISKTIAFDLKPSVVKDIDHYVINITVNYKYMSSISNEVSNDDIPTSGLG